MGVHLDRAWHFFQQARYDLAERSVRQELSVDPDNARAHALLGMCLTEQKQQEAALAEADEAIRLRPDLAYAHYVRAFIQCNREQLEPAAAAIEEALRLDPEDADYFALLSFIRAAQGRWRESLTSAEAGLRIQAEHVDCANRRALALVNLGRGSEAVAVIEAALARDPENPRTFANQGWVHLQRGDPDRALRHFREAMQISPRLKSVRQGVVDALLALIQQRQPFPDLGPFGAALRHDPELQEGRQKVVEALLQRWRSTLGGVLGCLAFVGWVFGVPLSRQVEAARAAHVQLTPLVVFIYIAGICFSAFFFTSRLADPLYCLLVRLERRGRELLFPEQVWASNWVGALFLMALGTTAAGVVLGELRALFAGALLLFLVLPLSAAYRCQAGRLRGTLIAGTLILAALGSVTLALAWADQPLANGLGALFLAGCGLAGYPVRWSAAVKKG